MPIEEQKAHRLPVIRWAFCFHCYLISQDAFDNAAHAAGAEWRGRRIGTHSRAVVFSFYATKNLTTAEGGMITTDDDEYAHEMRT